MLLGLLPHTTTKSFRDMNHDECISAFVADLPANDYDAIEELHKRYFALKPKLQPYMQNVDCLLKCFVALSEVLRDSGLTSVKEPALTGNVLSDPDAIDKYFNAAVSEVARLRISVRIERLRNEVRPLVGRTKGHAS